MNNVAEGMIFFLAGLVLILAGLALYLILLLARIEDLLWRVTRQLRPEVKRDWTGRPLYERRDI